MDYLKAAAQKVEQKVRRVSLLDCLRRVRRWKSASPRSKKNKQTIRPWSLRGETAPKVARSGQQQVNAVPFVQRLNKSKI